MRSRFLAALFVILLAAVSVAGPYSDLQARLKGLPASKVQSEVESSGLDDKDPNFGTLEEKDGSEQERAQAIRDYVGIRAQLEKSGPSTSSTPIKSIKSSGLYRKAEASGGENWLSRAMGRIRFQLPESKANPNIGTPSFDALGFLVYVVYGILGLAVILFLFFAIRYFALRAQSGTRKSKALMEDDEPERSVDEWLAMAASLEAEGRFREAIRCLYVAKLLRFDEHRVARFDRTETNWEHYRRIMASTNYPADFDFLRPTTEFDRFWYGKYPASPADVARFRNAYTELTGKLERPVAGVR